MEKVTLIFGRSNKLVGMLIRFFDISPWSHVAIVDGDYVYESVGTRYKGRIGRRKGVIITHIDDFKKRYESTVTKVIDCHNEKWLSDLQHMVRSKTNYDFLATVGALWFFRLLRIRLGSRDSHNCSELVNVVTHRFRKNYSPTVADFWRLAR